MKMTDRRRAYEARKLEAVVLPGFKPIPMNTMIYAPENLRLNEIPPKELGRTTLKRLCKVAKIKMRVTGGLEYSVILHRGTEHLRAKRAYYVGIGTRSWKPRDSVQALRILEILAHGFHDYAARECVCIRGIFTIPPK